MTPSLHARAWKDQRAHVCCLWAPSVYQCNALCESNSWGFYLPVQLREHTTFGRWDPQSRHARWSGKGVWISKLNTEPKWQPSANMKVFLTVHRYLEMPAGPKLTRFNFARCWVQVERFVRNTRFSSEVTAWSLSMSLTALPTTSTKRWQQPPRRKVHSRNFQDYHK